MPLRISLLCLPCAGASATAYLRWRRLLPSWVDVVPVELPGRGARLSEPLMHDFEALVSRLCDEHERAMAGPHVLFGHSMGALVARGMAARQAARGLPLARALMVAGSPAPSRRDPARLAGTRDDAALVADLRGQGGTPEAVFENDDMMRITLGVLAADYRVCDSHAYRGGQPLALPLHAYGGREDDVGAERLEAWAEETSRRFTVTWFEGGHFFLRQQEALLMPVMARHLMDALGAGVRETA